jgi:hypothetical protein
MEGSCFKYFRQSFAHRGTVVVMMLLNIVSKLQKYNPITLASDIMSLLTAQKDPADFTPALIICVSFIIELAAAFVMVINKK